MKRNRSLLLLFAVLSSTGVHAQEEKLGLSLPVEAGQGFQDLTPKAYLATFSIAPAWYLQVRKMNKLRAGAVVNLFYTNTGSDWSFGPRLAYRLNKTGELGNAVNYWVFGEATWSVDKRNLYGGGLMVALNPLEVSLHPQYEYYNQEFWFTLKVGVNLGIFFKKENNDPLEN